MQQAIFGGGCFWCTESVFLHVKGVQKVESGYAGGQRANPSYEQICTGATGHAEVIRIDFDESELSFDLLLDVFFATHDPTTLNRQGNDVGTQYRSEIFCLDDDQYLIADAMRRKFNKEIFKFLDLNTADYVYDLTSEKLSYDSFSTRGLLKMMNVKSICTTDDPLDDLSYHKEIKASNFGISYMKGLRNPTLYELFGTDNFGYSGNKNLLPEKSAY